MWVNISPHLDCSALRLKKIQSGVFVQEKVKEGISYLLSKVDSVGSQGSTVSWKMPFADAGALPAQGWAQNKFNVVKL